MPGLTLKGDVGFTERIFMSKGLIILVILVVMSVISDRSYIYYGLEVYPRLSLMSVYRVINDLLYRVVTYVGKI